MVNPLFYSGMGKLEATKGGCVRELCTAGSQNFIDKIKHISPEPGNGKRGEEKHMYVWPPPPQQMGGRSSQCVHPHIYCMNMSACPVGGSPRSQLVVADWEETQTVCQENQSAPVKHWVIFKQPVFMDWEHGLNFYKTNVCRNFVVLLIHIGSPFTCIFLFEAELSFVERDERSDSTAALVREDRILLG